MTRCRVILAAWAFSALGVVAASRADEPKWKQHTINGQSEFEAAGVFDVDNDGKLDILSGDNWYRAPDWKPNHVRDVARVSTYYHCFATLPLDLNGDGNTDYVTCSYFGKSVGWVENPGKRERLGPITKSPCRETSRRPGWSTYRETACLTFSPTRSMWWFGTRLSRRSMAKASSSRNTTSAPRPPDTASVRGDVNGDGRIDLLTPKGWFESPADPAHDTWTWHPDWQLGATGIQILARDVDGDGLSDVVVGMGHDYGLFWLHQAKAPNGERTWTKQAIDNSVASVHTLIWADIDGDGKANELVTGKASVCPRIEPGATDGSLIAWYGFDPNSKRWVRHIIFQGEPAKNAPEKPSDRLALKDFPKGTAGHRPSNDRDRYRQRRRP